MPRHQSGVVLTGKHRAGFRHVSRADLESSATPYVADILAQQPLLTEDDEGLSNPLRDMESLAFEAA